MKWIFLSKWLLLLLLFCFSCKKEQRAESFIVFEASGDIKTEVDRFRTALGPLNTAPGATGGRREVNWEGVPDALLDGPLPGNFFNPVGATAAASLQRGLSYDDNQFSVSANGFTALNPQAATGFRAFSGTKVFANTASLAWPVGFQVAGETTRASVSAFGAVFNDVDKAGSLTISFFEGDDLLGRFPVPARTDAAGFSFLGVQFLQRKITRVKVEHEGRLADGEKDLSEGGPKDLIVVDDFIYSEPVKY